jgi:hypothetical protein
MRAASMRAGRLHEGDPPGVAPTWPRGKEGAITGTPLPTVRLAGVDAQEAGEVGQVLGVGLPGGGSLAA